MLLDKNPELQVASRPRTLVISIAVHVVLLLLVALNPDWFDATPKRTIRIAGEDFDLSQLEIQPLYLPPIRPAPAAPPPEAIPAPTPQAVQPPIAQAAPPPPPPPPPPPAAQPPPNQIIRPDDMLVEGARPDGSPRASRGNTPDPARNGNPSQQAQQAQQAQAAQEEQKARQAQRGQNANDRVLPNNTNPNALQIPRPITMGDIGRIVDGQIAAARRNGQGGRTGISRSDNNGTFSTDSQVEILSPNPKGIDFGPYLNQLLTRLRQNWYTVMPEMARLGQRGRVDIVFTVTRAGNVKDMQVVVNSNYEALDQGAISAIKLSNPFQHLPAEYETDLKLHIGFLYNMEQ